jgi:hypothetical protein
MRPLLVAFLLAPALASAMTPAPTIRVCTDPGKCTDHHVRDVPSLLTKVDPAVADKVKQVAIHDNVDTQDLSPLVRFANLERVNLEYTIR